MGILHYLNVIEGDCSVIQHPSDHVTVLDVNNASIEKETELERMIRKAIAEAQRVPGNFNQKSYPVNPIGYMEQFNITSVFRFILSHPDMDHMGGIKDFFDTFNPVNFWDTDNTAEKEFEDDSPYNKEDWEFYKNLRDTDPASSPKRLTLFSGSHGAYYNRNAEGKSGGDGLYILAPTAELVDEANEAENYNDASYVILYRSVGGKILFGGDSHDNTWEYILENHSEDVSDVDLLIAPHHGRKSDRSYEFLEVVNPCLTFFGNASSKDLAYAAWRNRNLPFVTNNQANCMVVDADERPMLLYVTNKSYAEAVNPDTYFDERLKAYYCFQIE